MQNTAKVSPSSSQKRLLTINETVSQFGGSPWMWRSLVWSRQIPETRIGRLLFLDRSEIEGFISRRTQTA
jgi:hypothetical protein